MRSPAGVLDALLAADPARPRITVYDDTPAAGGERVELSARVLANWVAKAANALQEEWDVEPGHRVRLALPPHWRAVYWAFATWAGGACVALNGPGEVTVSDDPAQLVDSASTGVLVTLAALARGATVPPPAGAMDEARELATYPDRFVPLADPSAADPALADRDGVTAYGAVLELPPMEPGVRVHTTTTDIGSFLRTVLAAWDAGGSVVLSRGPGAMDLSSRCAAEGVTLALDARPRA